MLPASAPARQPSAGRPAIPIGLATTATKNAASDLELAKLGVSVTANAWAAGADVTVEATYPYEVNIMGMVVASGTLKSSTTERIE